MQELLVNLFSPGVLFLLFGLAVAFAVVVGVALSFHWKEYSTDAHKTGQFYKAYVFVSVILLGAMLLTIVLYINGT